jgi:hypothetical protein
MAAFSTIAGLLFLLFWIFSGKEVSDYLLFNLANAPLVIAGYVFSLAEKEPIFWLRVRLIFEK